jgi:hypothetical protein
MKRNLVLLVLVAALVMGVAGAATADVRLDFDIPVLLSAGLNVSAVTGNSSLNFDLSNLHIPLPFVSVAYQFGDSFLRGGVGVRSLIALVEFFGWPMGYVEVELDKLIFRAEVGGLGFFAVGVGNTFFTQDLLISDFQLNYAFLPWLRAGAGILYGAPLSNFSNNLWMFYINVRFTFDFK